MAPPGADGNPTPRTRRGEHRISDPRDRRRTHTRAQLLPHRPAAPDQIDILASARRRRSEAGLRSTESGGEPPSIYRCLDPPVILRLCRKHRGDPSTHNRSVTEVTLGVLSGGPGRGMIAKTYGTWQRARRSCTSITTRWCWHTPARCSPALPRAALVLALGRRVSRGVTTRLSRRL